MQELNKNIPWQILAFSWISILLTSLLFLFVLFCIKLGFEGFMAGEMGTMIGIFAIVGLIFLFPVLILAIFLIIGIFKTKKWAFIVSLIYSIIGAIIGVGSITLGFVPFILVMSVTAFVIWLNIYCLQYVSKR